MLSKWTFMAAAALLFVQVSNSHATPLLSDTFTYSNGVLHTVGSAVWTSAAGSAGDLLVSSGRAVINDSAGDDDSAALLASVNSGAIYASLIVNGDAADISSGTAGDYFATFLNSIGNQDGRLFAAKPAAAATGTYRLGVTSNTTGTANEVFYPLDLVAGANHLAVLRFDFTTKKTTLWVDPTLESDTSVDSLESITTPGTFTAFLLRQNGTTSMGDYFLDNLKIATTFAEVVPEPASLMLLALGAIPLMRRRRA